jgi:hypothetical protein
MTAARTARRKAIRLGRRSSVGDDPVRPIAPHSCLTATAGQRLDALSARPAVLQRPAARRCHPILFPQCTIPVHHPSDACCGQIPIEPAAPPLPTKRDFVPWRFSDACRRRTWMATSCRRPRNLHRKSGNRSLNGVLGKQIRFVGRAAHAGGAPQPGIVRSMQR